MNLTRLAQLLFTFALAASVGSLHAADAKKPNVLFILADDLGYGDLGCFGQQVIQTPRIDRLAQDGIRFVNCYAGSTVCAPSRCALMTGMHTGHARVRGNAQIPLKPEDVTVAELLQQAGYTTGIFGKWGLGEPETTGVPNRQGFHEWFGYLNQQHAHDYFPTYLWHNEERFDLPANHERKRGQYSPDLVIDRAVRFLSESKQRPWFLYLAMTLPHANNELGRETGNGMEIASDSPYADRAWPQPQKNHAAMITYLDTAVGRVLDHIESLGLTNDTLVFFASDNGPHQEGGADPAFFQSAGPLQGHKRDLYEGGIRTPMIVRWPGHVDAAITSSQVWAFWDVLPTLAEMADIEPPGGIDGISMWPAIVGPERAGHPIRNHEFLYWEFHERGSKQAVRMGDWKAIRNRQDAPLELYDLLSDPGETQDIAKHHPEVISQIESYLATARTESPDWPLKKGIND